MYCPECHAEYQEGITECADCGVTLVEQNPQEGPLKEVNWVALQKVDRVFGGMIKEVLDKENIPNYTKGDRLSSTFSMTTAGAIGGYFIFFVPEAYEDQARQIIKEMVGV
ncbi:MAG: DUF2007 domain-containing protein [FCB group bacterium]|nr:DUF2007 domain-containing protein [FCB group bacterium]